MVEAEFSEKDQNAHGVEENEEENEEGMGFSIGCQFLVDEALRNLLPTNKSKTIFMQVEMGIDASVDASALSPGTAAKLEADDKVTPTKGQKKRKKKEKVLKEPKDLVRCDREICSCVVRQQETSTKFLNIIECSVLDYLS